MKQLTTLIFFILVVSGSITALALEWKEQPSSAHSVSPTDNYYKIILDQLTDPQNKPHLIDAPVIKQLPELPRGCEVTSLAMLLNQAGVKVDKLTLAKKIKKDPSPYQVIDGKVHFGNPNIGFVGSLYSYSEPGLGVYHEPIANLAEQYLPGRIEDLTGKTFGTIQDNLDDGNPVWVIVSSTFKKVPDSEWMMWTTREGEIKVTKKEHSVLLTGYDEQYVYFNDPLSGTKNMKENKQSFIEAWKQFGSQAITYE